MVYLRLFLSFFLVFSILSHAAAEEASSFKMSFPLKCTLKKDCWMLYYVDVNRTPEVIEDYSCGKRTYDQHKGTDIVIKDAHVMNKGIDVLAAAPGTVLRFRDSVKDTFKSRKELDAVRNAGIECGNGIFIDHGDGYATQYCHLKEGSIIVEQGQTVNRGEKIGQVGISGLAEHPHLHLTLYKDKKLIDPFMGKSVEEDCHLDHYNMSHYWDSSMPARDEAPSFYDEGFTTKVPKFDLIPQGNKGPTLKAGAEALVYWIAMFDIRIGDYIVMKVDNAEGREIVKRTVSQEKDKIRQYYALGRKMADGVPAGEYTASIALTRVMDTGETKTYHHEYTYTVKD